MRVDGLVLKVWVGRLIKQGEVDDSIEMINQVVVVSDCNQGVVVAFDNIHEQFEDTHFIDRVEVACGLIGEQNRR